MSQTIDNSTKVATIAGVLLSMFFNLAREDILKTVFLAGTGAVVSFSVSLILTYLMRWIRKHFP